MSGVSVKIKVDDKKWREVKKALINTRSRVKVGILADSSHTSETGDDIGMLELTAIHEFGSPAANIPERSFIRSTLANKRPEINQVIETVVGGALKQVLASEDASGDEIEAASKQALGKLGAKVAAMIKRTIRDRETTGPEDQALQQATIDAKGSTLPLVDTGQLIAAITWAVVDEDGEPEDTEPTTPATAPEVAE